MSVSTNVFKLFWMPFAAYIFSKFWNTPEQQENVQLGDEFSTLCGNLNQRPILESTLSLFGALCGISLVSL